MPDIEFVRKDFSSEATLLKEQPESWFRRLLVWLGLREPLPKAALSLFQANLGAYRFETEDGRSAVVPVAMELVEQEPETAKASAELLAAWELGGA